MRVILPINIVRGKYKMKSNFKLKLVLASLFLVLAAPAYATDDYECHGKCTSSGTAGSQTMISNPLTVVDVDVDSHVSNKQGQLQGQVSAQKQDVSNTNSSTDSVAIAGDKVKVMYQQSHGVRTPTSSIPSTTSIQSTTGCGVMHKVKREVVNGKYFNLIAAPSDVNLGYTDTLLPADAPFKTYTAGNKSYLIGHEVIMTTTPISIAGARQFGLGGNGSNGGGGSGSIGSSGAMNQVVTTIQLRECIFAEGNK